MDNNYIKANNDFADKATKKLQKQHLPVDLDTFINLFNQGLINTRNPSIKEIVDLLTSGYMNVASQSNRIYVKSKTETIIEQSSFLLKQYRFVAILKRIANEMLSEDYPANTKLILKHDNPGFLFLEPSVDDLSDNSDPEDNQNTDENHDGFMPPLPSLHDDSDNEGNESENVESVDSNDESESVANDDKSYHAKDLELYTGAERFTASKSAIASNLFLKPIVHDYNVKEKTAYMNLGDIVNLSTEPVSHLEAFIDDTRKLMNESSDYQFNDNDTEE